MLSGKVIFVKDLVKKVIFLIVKKVIFLKDPFKGIKLTVAAPGAKGHKGSGIIVRET